MKINELIKDIERGVDVLERIKQRVETPTLSDKIRYGLRKIIPFNIRNKYLRKL